MQDFSEQVTISVDKMLGGMNKVIQETAVELFTQVKQRTPVKTASAVSDWELFINGMQVNTGKEFHGQYVPSQSTANSVAAQFRAESGAVLSQTKLKDDYMLKNETNYILLLENGGYNGPVHLRDPFPNYYPSPPFTPPFTLTRASMGRSEKSPLGMVKVTMLGASNVFQKMWDTYGRK